MSTNFYLRTPDGQEIHLGKRSVGWPFAFRGYPERAVADYESWRAQLDLGEIRDEYGVTHTAEEMEQIVTELRRLWGRWAGWSPHANQVDDAGGNRFTNTEFC